MKRRIGQDQGVSEPIRAAVVGYGLAGSVFHAPLIATDPAYELSAIVTSNPERSAAAAERYPSARIVPDLDALLADATGYDLVVLGSPTPTHAAVAGRTIERGLATVVDKPLAVHVAEAERLIALAADSGVPLTVFQNRRWDGDFLTVRRLLRERAVGDVWRFESRFEWLSTRPRPLWKSGTPGADGGGVAYDVGSHVIDQAIQLFGPVADVYGELDARRTDGVNDDDSFIALTHESGVRSHLAVCSLVAQRGFRFRVLGSDGAYTVWGLDGQEAQLKAGMSPLSSGYGVADPENYGKLGREGELTSVSTERGNYGDFYAKLATALRGDGPLPVDPRDVLEPLRIIERLHSQRRS
jgi:scyllo-inositol 2-dehydrogenase (NADP+)